MLKTCKVFKKQKNLINKQEKCHSIRTNPELAQMWELERQQILILTTSHMLEKIEND
jgi:hypothetical protein